MSPHLAALTVALELLQIYKSSKSDCLLEQAYQCLEETAFHLKEYHQTVRSIRWNRSRKAERLEVANQLEDIARLALEKLNEAGNYLNCYNGDATPSTGQSKTEDNWSEIIKLLVDARNWILEDYLKQPIIVQFVPKTKFQIESNTEEQVTQLSLFKFSTINSP